MLAVVYEMNVRPDKERVFRDAWHALTLEMKWFGSLGARLHLSESGSWIAYAQWPNQDTWLYGHRMIEEKVKQMHLNDYSLEVPVILLKLTVVDDLLELQGK